MKALSNRWVVDAKFRRWTLVSQWPVMLHEWAYRDLTTTGAAAWLARVSRHGVLSILSIVLSLLTLYMAFWTLSWFVSPVVCAWLSLAVYAVGVGSFLFSAAEGKAVGLFWLIALAENPAKLKERR